MAAISASTCCMGGVHVDEALKLLAGSAIRYLPFAGAPSGHPTRLGGAAPEVEAQCRTFAAKGCAGVDILAYRAIEADPLDLVAACRRGFVDSGVVVVAGSVNSPERVAAVRAAGADAFTIGTAAIDASYAPGAGPLAAQLGPSSPIVARSITRRQTGVSRTPFGARRTGSVTASQRRRDALTSASARPALPPPG